MGLVLMYRVTWLAAVCACVDRTGVCATVGSLCHTCDSIPVHKTCIGSTCIAVTSCVTMKT